METYTVLRVILSILFIYEGHKLSSAQLFDFSPPRQFQLMTMDLLHRGSFNTSDCVRELLNCWEIIKPDILCTRSIMYESVCGLIRKDCDDRFGLKDSKADTPIFESVCHHWRYEQKT